MAPVHLSFVYNNKQQSMYRDSMMTDAQKAIFCSSECFVLLNTVITVKVGNEAGWASPPCEPWVDGFGFVDLCRTNSKMGRDWLRFVNRLCVTSLKFVSLEIHFVGKKG